MQNSMLLINVRYVAPLAYSYENMWQEFCSSFGKRRLTNFY